MQLIAIGPDIPDALLQAHEEDRVVFFCGAGISSPAGLPGFRGLVDEIYRRVGTKPTDIEQAAYDRDQFDATLNLLEQRLPGGRLAVRRVLTEALKPKLRRKGAADTHAALLRLARTRKGALRLVTTNFDRIFEWVTRRHRLQVHTYTAPMLPIPKESRWNGLVYLHGLLPAGTDDSELQRLVLTSGDFGLAYLTERWAARFVSELFRKYVVCFIGYSINDPVLRYMMDALAADRMLGEHTPPAYALADCEPGNEKTKGEEWKSKGVAPILYEVPTGSNNHSALHRTLKVWAETYRDGVLGRERIVVDYALARPSASTPQDDFVGRMLWALSDPSGLPAKRFAELDPVPPLEWLTVFTEGRFHQGDLDRFGVPRGNPVDKKLHFSLIHRPSPSVKAPRMSLVSWGTDDSAFDHVMFQLARWLVRHLNDPELIIWIAEQGGQLHETWSSMIESELKRIFRLEKEGRTTELAELSTNAPNAVPQPLMRTLWRLLLTGRVSSKQRYLELYRWGDRLERDGLTTTLRLELRSLLAPKVLLQKPLRSGEAERNAATAERLSQLVGWKLVLAFDDVHDWLGRLAESAQWQTALPNLLDDFQQLLRDVLDLLRELHAADERGDPSFPDLPSVSPHGQNRGFRDWVALIELLRDAWLAVREADPQRATRIARDWFTLPYPAFKRLALFAASQDGCIASEQWVDWLTADGAWWLWSRETQRETMRLLVLQGARLSPEPKEKLETAILRGPPRAMFRENIESENWNSVVDHSVWLRLAKLGEGGSDLGAAALPRFKDLSEKHRNWRLADHERDEFPHWMSVTGEPGHEDIRDINIAPRKRQELVEWLEQTPPARPPFHEDTWRETCRKHPLNTLCALSDLAQEGNWPSNRWQEALYAWSARKLPRRLWRFAAPLVQTMPDNVFEDVVHPVAWWLELVSKSTDRHEAIFFDLCRRILALSHPQGVDTDEPVNDAINHPVGHVTQAVINLWLKRQPNDNDTLPEDIEPFFTQLCDTSATKFRPGRVLLAAHLIALFRADRPWTQKHLLPLFDWRAAPVETKAVWEGFLWSPRRFQPLQIAFKEQFLSTARHYAQLGKHSSQFAKFITYVALDPAEGYTSEDFRSAIGALPQKGLKEVAQALAQALEGAGEQREEYWRNRVQPFWQEVWPKSGNLVSSGIAQSLARLSIAAGAAFPSALAAVADWLQPVEHPYFVFSQLKESGLAGQFPEDALRLLDAIIDDNQAWVTDDLNHCMTAIAEAKPALTLDHRYQRLADLARRGAIGQ